MKYIFVTGGVVSGIGKGIASCSFGVILQSFGLNVTAIKIDPYINVDAGTFSPYEHGEVFVLNDGSEVDQDLGNYERFLGVCLTGKHNITTGKVYQQVIQDERNGKYLGKTVQIVPHITDHIQRLIDDVSKLPITTYDGKEVVPDVCLVEFGGTIGDIEGMPFFEAARQMSYNLDNNDVFVVHVSLVPELKPTGEQKTKPTQHSVQKLREVGLIPDLIICRSTNRLDESTKVKISSFCYTKPFNVINCHDVDSIYSIPSTLMEQNVDKILINRLNLSHIVHNKTLSLNLKLQSFEDFAAKLKMANRIVKIAMVGKYTEQEDTYLSLCQALYHAALFAGMKLIIEKIESSTLEDPNDPNFNSNISRLKSCHGLLIPPGYGVRGTEGMIKAIKYAREENIPFFGICFGMQMAVVEFSRNVCGLEKANSTECDLSTPHPVIMVMEQHNKGQMGGTMRLGSQKSFFSMKYPDSISRKLYGNSNSIFERHRHRYEVNPDYVETITAQGLNFVAKTKDEVRMEIVELSTSDHPYFVGVQFHPEFLSCVERPSPLFVGFIKASCSLAGHNLD